VEHGMVYRDTVLTLNDKVMIDPLSLNDFSDLPAVDPVIVCKVHQAPAPSQNACGHCLCAHDDQVSSSQRNSLYTDHLECVSKRHLPLTRVTFLLSHQQKELYSTAAGLQAHGAEGTKSMSRASAKD
jgi:hypothetical protein